MIAFSTILSLNELIVISIYWGNNAGIIVSRRLFNLNLRNRTWRSFYFTVSDNTSPVRTIISSINFIVIGPFPLTCTISLTIVALTDIVSGSCELIEIWNCPSLRTSFLGTENLLSLWWFMIEIENLILLFWSFALGYWCLNRIFIHFEILSNWAWRSLDKVVS
jgi:hypothetical protein